MFYVYIILALTAGIVAISIPYATFERKRRNEKIEKVFGERESLDEKDFYERYFEEKGVPFYVVKKVRKILEEELDTDFSRLSAEDDFSQNLSFLWEYDSLVDVEITMRFEEEFDIKISDEEAPNYRTVDEIINLVWQKVRGKNESAN
jgi:acyl carrier protein